VGGGIQCGKIDCEVAQISAGEILEPSQASHGGPRMRRVCEIQSVLQGERADSAGHWWVAVRAGELDLELQDGRATEWR
jgi:hypothetical protein